VNRRERLAEAKTWAGYRSAHFARSTGTMVVVVNTAEHDLDPADGGNWTLVCDDHSTLLQTDTLALARLHAAAPEEWCPDCRGDERDPHSPDTKEEPLDVSEPHESRPYDLGRIAFERGDDRIVPRSLLVEEGIEAAKAWYRGWDEANLAAPWDEEDEDPPAEPSSEEDPFPVGTMATVLDHDGETVLGPYKVVRSYWPKPVVELLIDGHMVRQNHDRMTKAAIPAPRSDRARQLGCTCPRFPTSDPLAAALKGGLEKQDPELEWVDKDCPLHGGT
jgi:hypothetical protein